MNPSVQALNLSASTSTSTATPQENEITTLIPDKEKLLSDLKAFTSHHEMTTALEGKKLKEKEQELEKATMEIAKLNTEIADLKNQVKGTAFLWKENEGLKKHNTDLTHNLQTTAAKNGKLETSLKEKEEKISRLEQDNKKLSETNMSNQQYKQKVELATQIFRSPIRNVTINNQNNETHFAISGPLNEGTGAANGAANENENGNGAGKSESSISEHQYSKIPRGVNTAKRGRWY